VIGAGVLWNQFGLYLRPEGVMLLFGFLVILLDLKLQDKRPLAVIGLIGSAIAAVLAFMSPTTGPGMVIFSGMVTCDHFALFFKVFAALVVFLIILSSMDYKKLSSNFAGEYYAFLLLVGAGIMFLASANNLLMIFLSLEYVSITSYILVGFERNERRSKEASLKYFLFGAICTAVMLYGFSLLFGITGSLDLPAIKEQLADGQNTIMTSMAMLFILAGLGFKVAMVPFHAWVPDTYEGAPTPITAFLSVGSKAAGFAVLLRFFFTVFPGVEYHLYWLYVIGILSVITMTVANAIACSQYNLKRLLGYSSIAQAGYILMAFVVMDSAYSQPAVMIYLFAYLFMNVGAFAVVILVSNSAGGEDLEDFAGLGERSPMLAWALLIFLLSLAGIPPLGGWIGKWAIFATLVKGNLDGVAGGGAMLWFAIALAVNSVIAAYYYFIIVKTMFLTTSRERMPKVQYTPTLMVAVWISIILTFAIGVFPEPFWNWVSSLAL
jgi:NADH-quinone oxidoreductase subunit N